MKHAALILAALALLVPAALAANGEPTKKLTATGQARARAVALKASDFGAGWKAEPSNSKNQSNPRCSTYNPDQSDLIETGDYDSPDFTRADGSFVSSTVGVFRSIGMAQTGYARVAVPQLPACFAELFKNGAKPTPVTIISVGRLSFATYGNRTNAYRLTASVKSGSTNVPVTIDIVLFNRGSVDAAFIFLGISKPLPSSFEQSLVSRAAARAG